MAPSRHDISIGIFEQSTTSSQYTPSLWSKYRGISPADRAMRGSVLPLNSESSEAFYAVQNDLGICQKLPSIMFGVRLPFSTLVCCLTWYDPRYGCMTFLWVYHQKSQCGMNTVSLGLTWYTFSLGEVAWPMIVMFYWYKCHWRIATSGSIISVFVATSSKLENWLHVM